MNFYKLSRFPVGYILARCLVYLFDALLVALLLGLMHYALAQPAGISYRIACHDQRQRPVLTPTAEGLSVECGYTGTLHTTGEGPNHLPRRVLVLHDQHLTIACSPELVDVFGIGSDGMVRVDCVSPPPTL